jgi:hypothetical protein
MLGGGGLATLLARLDIGEVTACHKAKKRCKRGSQCCSGRCKKGKCKGNAKPPVDVCLGREVQDACGDGCFCFESVNGAVVCGDASASGCSTDAQCALLTGPGSICFFNKDGEGECAAPCANPL